ncbi:TraK family protein [Neisseria gonorrhoeae]|uniref:TraK family protein n=2 Tax=Neisseria gonorrhoeae TaxID=485 RepID=UPI0020424716|nr:TraK family protein [Neisseria gonorrhoeae]
MYMYITYLAPILGFNTPRIIRQIIQYIEHILMTNRLKMLYHKQKNDLLYRIIVFKTILLGSFGKALSKNWQSPIEMIQMGKIEKLVLAELAAMQKKGSSAGNKARFLAMQEDIKILLVDRNIPVISVWRILSEKKYVPYSYETFNRYCKMYIFKSDTTAADQTDTAQSTQEKPDSIRTDKEPPSPASEPIIAGGNTKSSSGFTFNNNPDGKDLF